MLRISRLTDYGLVLLSHMATDAVRPMSANELSVGTGLPLPTVSKLLQILTKDRLLTSHRGAKGGYVLARSADQISVAAIVSALEGPVALAMCTVDPSGECEYEGRCHLRGHLMKINSAITRTLEGITLAEIAAGPLPVRNTSIRVTAPDQAPA